AAKPHGPSQEPTSGETPDFSPIATYTAQYKPMTEVRRPRPRPPAAPQEKLAVPGWMLRPTKAQLLRFALLNTTGDKDFDSRLRVAFRGDVVDADYVHRKIDRPQYAELRRRTVKRIPLAKAIEETETLTQLADLIDLRLPFARQQVELSDEPDGKAWDALERKLSGFMDAAGPVDTAKRKEVLMLLHDIMVRLTMRRPNERNLQSALIAVLKVAASTPSPQALAHYLHKYYNRGHGNLPITAAMSIVRRLTTRIGVLQWEGRQADLDKQLLLEVVTGVDWHGKKMVMETQSNLFSSVAWQRPSIRTYDCIKEYAKLLVLLGDTSQLRRLLPIFEKRLGRKNRKAAADKPNAAGVDPVISVVAACIDACVITDNTSLAIEFALLLSRVRPLDEVLPPRTVDTLLLHDEAMELHKFMKAWKEESFLVRQLERIEARLGAKWDEKGEKHVFAKGLEMWEGQPDDGAPSGTIPGDAIDLNAIRLLEEISENGSSTYIDQLAMVADILEDADGSMVPLGTSSHPSGSGSAPVQFAWFPQASPVEFDSARPQAIRELDPFKRTPADLGLLRARPAIDGKPCATEQTCNLLQVGWIGARAEQQGKQKQDGDAKFETTGHVLAWDRMRHTFVVVYLGKGYGVVKNGPMGVPPVDSVLPYTFGDVDLGALVRGKGAGEGEGQRRGLREMLEASVKGENGTREWFVDVDTGVCPWM
ncbi:hypothetical protein KEM55_000383, partial [Ascosphaera atra]